VWVLAARRNELSSEVRESETVSPTPETGVLPKLATKHWSLAFINSMFDDGSG